MQSLAAAVAPCVPRPTKDRFAFPGETTPLLSRTAQSRSVAVCLTGRRREFVLRQTQRRQDWHLMVGPPILTLHSWSEDNSRSYILVPRVPVHVDQRAGIRGERVAISRGN